MFFENVVYAAGNAPVKEATQEVAKNPGFEKFIPLILMLGVFYLLMYIPQKKRDKAHKELISSIEEGDEVITSSGIKGEIVSKNDEFYEIRVDKGVKLTIKKSAIGSIYKKKSTTNL